jgi:MFS family permease
MAMAGVSITLLPSVPAMLFGLVLCSTGVFICQSASTSYIQRAAPSGGRASAAGLYVSAYYIGGSVAGVLPAYLWRFGEWKACVMLVLAVQILTIATAGTVWQGRQPAHQPADGLR